MKKKKKKEEKSKFTNFRLGIKPLLASYDPIIPIFKTGHCYCLGTRARTRVWLYPLYTGELLENLRNLLGKYLYLSEQVRLPIYFPVALGQMLSEFSLL